MRRIAGGQGGSGRSSSHVMSALARAMAGIYGCFYYIRSFFLIRTNQRIKADIKGLPHMAGAPPPCRPWPAHPPQLDFGIPVHGIRAGNSTATDKAPLFTLMADPHSANAERHSLHCQRTTILSPLCVIARRNKPATSEAWWKRSIYERFM